MIFNTYEWIPIVNLPERTDRRRQMEREFAKLGMANDPRVQFFPAIRMQDPGPFARAGSHGNFLGHLEILEQSAEKGCWTLILEDDCAFRPVARNYQVPHCDIFYGGWGWASNPDDLHGSEIIGSHCIGFSPKAAKLAVPYLKAFLSDPDFRADPEAAAKPDYNPNIRPPIDGALVWFRRAHPELTTHFADLAFQRSSRTDVGSKKWFDKVPGLRDIAEKLRRLR